MSKYFRVVAVGEDGTDEPVKYVGCYVLRWGKDDQPTVGFVPVDEDVEARVEELEALLADALYLFYHPDRVRKLIMIDRIEQALEGDDDGH